MQSLSWSLLVSGSIHVPGFILSSLCGPSDAPLEGGFQLQSFGLSTLVCHS